jgi:hypothetical protein
MGKDVPGLTKSIFLILQNIFLLKGVPSVVGFPHCVGSREGRAWYNSSRGGCKGWARWVMAPPQFFNPLYLGLGTQQNKQTFV